MTAINDDRKAELEREIAALIQKRLPQAAGSDVKIEIFDKDGGGGSGEIRIAFGSPFPPDALGDASSRRLDLIESLALTELRLGRRVISLEWFRDKALVDEFPWAREYAARSQALNAAILDGVIITDEAYNPNAPDSPLTAVRLNRYHPEAPGSDAARRAFDFKPVKIRGKPLSQTVIEERREGW